MTIDNPILFLRREHDEALAALNRLDAAGRDIRILGAREAVADIVAFLDHDVRGHNEREERCLFPMLELYLPPSGPTAVMRSEHREVWHLLENLKRALASPATELDGVAMTAAAVVVLLRSHIEKENRILFPMAEQLLSGAEMAEVAQDMEKLLERGAGAPAR